MPGDAVWALMGIDGLASCHVTGHSPLIRSGANQQMYAAYIGKLSKIV